MWPDRVSNLGPLIYESDGLPTALRGPAAWLDRTDLLKQSRDRKRQVDRVPLVLTYSSLLPNRRDTVFTHMHILYQPERKERVFCESAAGRV